MLNAAANVFVQTREVHLTSHHATLAAWWAIFLPCYRCTAKSGEMDTSQGAHPATRLTGDAVGC